MEINYSTALLTKQQENMTKAAQRLQLFSQSTLSKQLKNLEEELENAYLYGITFVYQCNRGACCDSRRSKPQ